MRAKVPLPVDTHFLLHVSGGDVGEVPLAVGRVVRPERLTCGRFVDASDGPPCSFPTCNADKDLEQLFVFSDGTE